MSNNKITVTKRDGRKVDFDKDKIKIAILKAFISIDKEASNYANYVAKSIADYVESLNKNMTIEEIQDIVVDKLMDYSRKDVSVAYIEYRYKRSIIREFNTTDENIFTLIDGTNDYWNNENSNKNSCEVTVQRDYISGITSKDITERFLLPEDVVKAHTEGYIHFHDSDYFVQHITNCCLINLDDMLQNGTVINGVTIDKPHRLITAVTIATQIITAVTSSQYGGATITLTHLAPFVRDSYKRHLSKYNNWGIDKDTAIEYAKRDLKKEVEDAVQTFNYQCNSMSTTNGQAPFLSVCMYLNETDDYKEELAMLIEEFLKQRMLGMKNEVGVYVTPAFPKLLYVLEEDNVNPDSKYWYLTELAAKCTAKRMVPDYISEKVMLENKIDKNGNGNCYPCMGCVDGKSVIDYKIRDCRFVESFERAWNRLISTFPISDQPNGKDQYIDVNDVTIYDHVKNEYVNVSRFIRNTQYEWIDIEFTNGRFIEVTDDHLFEVDGIGKVYAKDLSKGDTIQRLVSRSSDNDKNDDGLTLNNSSSWFEGVILSSGTYDGSFNIIINNDKEKVINRISEIINNYDTKSIITDSYDINNEHLKCISVVNSKPFISKYCDMFEGVSMEKRHIPTYVFSMSRNSKMEFLAGMIDARGSIIYLKGGVDVIQLTNINNEELAMQQMILAADLGLNALVSKNKIDDSHIEYRVRFNCTDELYRYLTYKDIYESYGTSGDIIGSDNIDSIVCRVKNINYNLRKAYSYDVTCDDHHFTVNGIWSHNCRSFLTPYIDKDCKPKYYGRFNQGVVTVSLPDIAMSSGGDIDKFWDIFEERVELCHKALQCRHKRLEGTVADAAPIMWRHGALARLDKGEVIDELLHDGYSTLSLGYAGLYECVKYMTGHSHTDHGIGEEFGLKIMKELNNKTSKWKADEHIDYSLYGTPIESTTYKFAKSLKTRFGDDIFIKLDGKDRNYITNSYHVPVFEKIDPFEKLAIESEFQKLSPGGAISYVECADLTNNIGVVLQVMRYIYDNIMYAELNTKSDYCQVCGYDGEIKIIDDDNQLAWECPNCGNRDQNKMNVARRTCGYIGQHFWNQGRTDEIRNRYVHVDDHSISERE